MRNKDSTPLTVVMYIRTYLHDQFNHYFGRYIFFITISIQNEEKQYRKKTKKLIELLCVCNVNQIQTTYKLPLHRCNVSNQNNYKIAIRGLL